MSFELGCSGQSSTTRFQGLSGGKTSRAETDGVGLGRVEHHRLVDRRHLRLADAPTRPGRRRRIGCLRHRGEARGRTRWRRDHSRGDRGRRNGFSVHLSHSESAAPHSHNCVSAISIARSRPIALFIVSSYSLAGHAVGDDARRRPARTPSGPCSTIVRRAMQVSMLPLKST